MKSYKDETVGTIAIIKNIPFEDNEKTMIDHSWKAGRPCVILYEDTDYFYFLTLTSRERFGVYEKEYYKLQEEDLLYKYKYRYKNESGKKRESKELSGFANLAHTYKIPIYGLDEIGKLRFDVYKKIIEKYKEFHGKEIDEAIKNSTTVKR